METQSKTSRTDVEKELLIKMALSAWQTQNDRVDKLLTKLSDEQLAGEVAPGKNSGTYLLGHLVAVNDNLLPLLGLSEKLYPELEKVFLSSPDKSGLEKPPTSNLRQYWKDVNAKLTGYFEKMKPDEWFTRHNSVSPEDFAKEPHRNKVNVIMNRTSHQSYHLGQLVLLEKK